MDADYDLIVAGAGPAGSALARFAGRAGLSVLLLDQARFPREKPCGDTISSASLALLDELGVLPELLRVPHVPVSRISYFAPDGESVTVPLPRVERAAPTASLVCRRVLLDDVLLTAAREVAEVRDWTRVTHVLVEDGRACGVRVDAGGGRERTITCRLLAGADGARSRVARDMGAPRTPRIRTLAARAYYRSVLGMQGCLEVHFLHETLPGFLWISPTESGLTNVGLAAPLDDAIRNRLKPRRALAAALASDRLRERFEFAEAAGPAEVSLLPVGSPLREIHGPGWLLVGDAAGLVNPCSAEGVANALLSAKVAAEVAARACAAGDFSADALGAYPYRLWKELAPGLRMAGRLLALRTPKAIGSLVRSAARRPHNAAWISGILLGSALPTEETEQLLSYLDFFSRG
ncbi:MAG: geranylgeranyl reductase family protein [Thermodesulfobacteriota bacterium]